MRSFPFSAIESSYSFLVQALQSFLVFQSASLTFTKIVSVSLDRRSNIPLIVFFQSSQPLLKTIQAVPPFVEVTVGKGFEVRIPMI